MPRTVRKYLENNIPLETMVMGCQESNKIWTGLIFLLTLIMFI